MQPPAFLPNVAFNPQSSGPPMPIPAPPPRQLHNYPQPPTMPSPPHQQPKQPKQQLLTPFSRLEAKTALRLEANHALRLERQHQERAKHEMAQLHSDRRAVLDALRSEGANLKGLTASLEYIETENEQWRTPNANLAEMYRLRDEIARVEKLVRDAHGRWDELGERIEEKHVEIAFGVGGGD